MGSVSAPAILPALRALVARFERRGDLSAPARAGLCLAFGVAKIDRRLPGGGLLRGALHEIGGGGAQGASPGIEAALGFMAGIAGRARGPVLWVVPRVELYGPGLAMAGLAPERLLLAEAGGDKQVLAAMEEGLRQPGLAVVIGEVREASLTASRRLQLAAGKSGALALLLCRGPSSGASAAVTRWHVSAVPGPGRVRGQADPGLSDLGRAQWRLDLLRCRGGSPMSWIVEACDAQGRLDLVAELADRSAAPVLAPAGIGPSRRRA